MPDDAMKSVTVRGFAKINLFLDVTGRRADGYHLVNMVMQSLDLHDTLRIERTGRPGKSRLEIRDPDGRFSGLEDDERNLVLRAEKALRERYSEKIPQEEGLHFTLEKNIPMGAGLAGGSADAAAALIGLDRLFSLGLSDQEIAEAGLSLGADIPYCLTGGTMRSQGIGEILTPLPKLPDCTVLLVKPQGSASTKEIYTALDGGEILHPSWETFSEVLGAGDLQGVAGLLSNVLEPVTAPMIPDIDVIRRELLAAGALGARMTGSGSVVFGIFAEEEAAAGAQEKLREGHPEWDIRTARPITLDTVRAHRFAEEGE